MSKNATKISALAAAMVIGLSSVASAQTWTNADAANTNPSETTQNGTVTEQLMIQEKGAMHSGAYGSSAVSTNDSMGPRMGVNDLGAPVSPKNTTNPSESQRGDSTIEELQKRF